MKRPPMTERMMIAKTETTIQLQALRAETTGFMMAVGRTVRRYPVWKAF